MRHAFFPYCCLYILYRYYTITNYSSLFKVNHFTRYGLQEQFIGDDVEQLKQKARAKEQSIMDDIDFQRVSF